MDNQLVLSKAEQDELTRRELNIAKNLQTFFEVGQDLSVIKERKLYRQHYLTFADYCEEKWHFSRFRAYQYIEASEVYSNLLDAIDNPEIINTNLEMLTIVNKNRPPMLPETESQLRPLSDLPKKDQPKAWAETQKTTGKIQPTAKEVAETVKTFPAYGLSKSAQIARSKPAAPKHSVSTSGAGFGAGPSIDSDFGGGEDDYNQAGFDSDTNQNGNNKSANYKDRLEAWLMAGAEFDDGSTCPYCRK